MRVQLRRPKDVRIVRWLEIVLAEGGNGKLAWLSRLRCRPYRARELLSLIFAAIHERMQQRPSGRGGHRECKRHRNVRSIP